MVPRFLVELVWQPVNLFHCRRKDFCHHKVFVLFILYFKIWGQVPPPAMPGFYSFFFFPHFYADVILSQRSFIDFELTWINKHCMLFELTTFPWFQRSISRKLWIFWYWLYVWFLLYWYFYFLIPIINTCVRVHLKILRSYKWYLDKTLQLGRMLWG